jgi:Flp pilus assembly protein TadD
MRKKRSAEDKAKYVRMERGVLEDVSNFLFAVGNQFVQVKNAEGAFECFKRSVDLNPKNHPSVYNLGALYSSMGQFDSAYRMFREVSRMDASNIRSRIALAEVARKLWKLDEAKQLLNDAIKEDPQNYPAMSSMAILCYDQGRLAEANEWNERGLALSPSDTHMLLNQALIRMTYGDWAGGWPQYEYCLSYNRNEKMRGLGMSDSWSGQTCEGKTLLVVSDQGAGDAIQFSRYLAEAKELGKFGKLVFLVPQDLTSLMSRVSGVDEAVGFNERMKVDYDHHSSLLGIMRVLKISPENCRREPHILASNDPGRLSEVWKYRVNSRWDGKSRKVAMVWAGDPKHGNDAARSLPLAQFLKLLQVDGVQLYSLQVAEPSKQLKALPEDLCDRIVDLGEDLRNYDDTAAVLTHMDLLVSCDTSAAHLAGGLGLPVCLLVGNPPEWRWGLDKITTEWYDSVNIFRQKEPRNWDQPMSAVLFQLKYWSRSGANLWTR